MLNNEMIIKRYNEYAFADVDPYCEEVLDGLVDLEMLGITEEQIIECIDAGLFASVDDLLNAELIQNHFKEKGGKKKAKKGKTTKKSNDNPFGMFEEAVKQIVENQAADISKDITEQTLNTWIEQNSQRIVRPITYVDPSGREMNDVTHEKFEEIVVTVNANIPTLLVGPAGTGKNHLCKQVADFLGLDFYFANAVTQEHKLTGFIDANGVYHETQFYKAFKNGGLFMFDELDASDREVLVTFNAALANGYMDFPVGRIDAHEDFRVIAAANTFGTGASMEYVGRTQLDAATLNRFLYQTVIDYSPRIEDALTEDRDLLEFIRTFRAACEEYGINHIASYRQIQGCDALVKVLGYAKTVKGCVVQNLENDDLNMIVNKFKDKADAWSTALCELAVA